MKKRFVSVILALCMVLGMVPLKAFAAESGAFAEPKVTQLTVSYDGGEPVDLLGNQPTISMPAGSKPVFTVTFDSTELLNKVFVTSTKDGETKYLEATLQDGKYVTDSYFDPNDTNYIPGTIAVTYSKKTLKIDESGNIGGTDLNTLKTQLTAQGVSSRNEATGADGTVTAEIVLGDTFGTMANVYFDAAVSEFTVGAGVDQSELNKWLGVYQNLSQLSSYDLEDADGKQFTLYLGDGKDFSDPDTYLMLVKDATSNKYTKMLLNKGADKAGLGDISDSLASANVVTKKLLEYNAISKDTVALREEIEAHPTMTAQEKAEANAKIDALDRDKKLFLIGMTAISILNPAGASLMLSALAAGYTSMADYFWEKRVGMILGNESPMSELAVSGTCGEHLNWSLNGGGTLTISGYGPMTEFPSKPKTPWYPYTYSGHIKKVIINSGATSIGRAAFGDCYQLTSVSIPNTVESIGEYAFSGCNRLEKIAIPGSVNTMGAHVFDDCCNLTTAGPIGGNYDIQFGWEEEIPANAFLTTGSSITNIVIPDGIKRIGDSAFSLTDIEHVQIPESVISIGSHAFASTKLSSVTVPNSVIHIGTNAFSGCTDLTSIILSSNLTSIGNNAFYNTEYYNNASNWDQDVLYIGSTLIKARSSVSGDYQIKSGTNCIADQAFNNGTSYFNALTSVIMPSSMIYIGRNAFDGCRNSQGLTGIYFKGDAPTVYDGGTSEKSFYDHTKLFYIEGKEGWDTAGDSRWHGYPVATWEGDDDPTIKEDVIVVTPSTGGNVTFTPSEPADGDTVTITVTPDSGYQGGAPVVKDSGGNTIPVTDAGNGKYTFTKPAGQVTITAPEFTRPTYSVTAPVSTPNGSVTVSAAAVHEGDTVTITVTPNAGYQGSVPVVKDADGNTLAITDAGNGKYTFVMPAKNVVVTAAEFTPTSYTITGPSKPSNGTVSLSAATAHKGDTVTITVTPDVNFTAKTPVVTGASGNVAVTKVSDTTYTFVMPEGNVTVDASFSVINFTLAYTPYASMTDADKKLYYGGKLEITGLVPNTKYVVTFDNGLAAPKQVNGRNVIPRIAHVVTSDAAGKVALGCQDSMNVMVFGVSNGGNVTTDLVELYAKNHAGVPVSGLASRASGT